MEPARLSPEGHYRIDCDPEIFSVILNWLRYGQVELLPLLLGNLETLLQVLLPTWMTRHTVSVVAEYFGLSALVAQLAPPPPPDTVVQVTGPAS